MTAIIKAVIKSYDPATHKATVQTTGSLPHFLTDVPVAASVPADDCIAGQECSVLAFDPHNPTDAVVTDVHGSLPSTFALLAGRSGGQTLIGGLASGEHLTLQSTAHATRGYVRAQDDLQLLSNIIRDAAGTARLTLATASPHVSLAGDLNVSAHAAIGGYASPSTATILTIAGLLSSDMYAYGININVQGTRTSGVQITYGVTGSAEARGTPTYANVAGLYFLAKYNSPSNCSYLGGCAAFMQSGASATGLLAIARAFHAPAANWTGAKPNAAYGLDIEDQGGASVPTATGIRVNQQTATVSTLLILAGLYGIPYLQVIGGALPGAAQTNVYLWEGTSPALRRVQWKDGAAIGAGDRVMVLV